MNIGDIVGLVETVIEDGVPVARKVPALVTQVYKDAHDQVVADLHKLESNVHGVISVENNPPEAMPPTGLTVTSDLSQPPSPEEQKQAAATAAAAPPAAPSAQLTEEESAFSKLSDEDKAAFAEWQSQQKAASSGDGGPTA